jgi:hypothetical protein
MSEQNQPYDTLQEVKDIKRLMEKSSRFSSLSGLSCIAVGVCALIGAFMAYRILTEFYGDDLSRWNWSNRSILEMEIKLLTVAAITFAVAILSALFFTWRKAKQQNVSMIGHSSRLVFWNIAVPLAAGGLFIMGMMMNDEWRFVAPACLVFYGLALVNAGKYTVSDIRYLGYCEIALGLVNIFWSGYQIGYGLYFWAFGFGVLHIIYGIIMWWKYDRN